jgi:TolB protein
LHRFNTLNGRVSAAFIGEPGVSSLVALGAPHYVQWSPDSKTIAFIVSSREGLKMYATDISLDPSPRHMMDDGPLWFDWSPDSTSLIVHRGTDHFSLDADTETPTAVEIDSDQFGHRVATWTPDGGGITYLTGSLSEGYALNVSSTDGEVTRLADGLSAGATFQWSPNGAAIAVSDTEAVARVPNLGLLVFPHISIYDSSASAVLASVQAPVVSYFWSPDSTKIALVTLAADFSALQWHVLDVGTGDTWKLVDFRPSADQLTVFQYFDQYVQSHSMWSPDSESLVFSGTLTGSGRSISYGVQQQTPQVYVVSVDRQPEVYTLAEGTLAFWSPR